MSEVRDDIPLSKFFHLTKTAAKAYGAKGGKKTPNYVIRVGDDYVTYKQIAARVGVTTDTICKRLKRLRDQDVAPTWELLGVTLKEPK